MTRSSVFVVWVVLLLAGTRGVRGVPLRGHSGVIFGTEFLRILDDHAGVSGYDEGLEHPTRLLARDEGRGEPAETRNDRLSSSAIWAESESEGGGSPVFSSRVSSRDSRRLGTGSSGSSLPGSSSSGSLASSLPSNLETVNRLGQRTLGKVESSPAFSFLSEFSDALSNSTFTEDDYKYLTDYYYYDLYADDADTTTIPAPTTRRGERTRLLHPASTTTTEAPPPPPSTTTTTTTTEKSTTTTTTTTTEPPSTTTTTQSPPSTTSTTTTTTTEPSSATTTSTGSPPSKMPPAASPRAFRYTTMRPKSGGKSGGRARRPSSPARLANKVGDARSRSSASSVVVEVRVESPTTSAPSTTTTAAATPRHRGRSARPVQAAEELGPASHLLTHPLVVQMRDGAPATGRRGTLGPRSAATTDAPHTTTTTTTTTAATTTSSTTTTPATTTTTTTTVAPAAGEAEVVEQSVVASVTRSEAQNSAPQRPHVGSPEAQQGMAPQGLAPFGHAPEGWAPFGTAPEGVAPRGVLPGGVHPEGVAPEGAVGLRLVDASVAAGGAAANSTVGYVVESHNVRRFRHEERTPEGLIIGEYGEVDHQTGDVNGVRYVADSTADPRLIYDSLMTFLQL